MTQNKDGTPALGFCWNGWRGRVHTVERGLGLSVPPAATRESLWEDGLHSRMQNQKEERQVPEGLFPAPGSSHA